MITGIESSGVVNDRTKLATSMVHDFESFLTKQGLALACTVIVDLQNVRESILTGKIPMVVLFGRGMNKNTVADVIRQLGNSADDILKGSIMVTGDGDVVSNT